MCLCVMYKDGWRSTGGESGKHKGVRKGERQGERQAGEGREGGEGRGGGNDGGGGSEKTTTMTATTTQIKSTQETIHNASPKGIEKGTMGRSDSTHTAVWATVALFEPVFSTSDRGKESFAAQLVIDVVPSLGGFSQYSSILLFVLFCFVLFCFVFFILLYVVWFNLSVLFCFVLFGIVLTVT